MARTHLKARLIFDRCVDFLIQNRMQVPSSYRLNDLIRVGLHDRKAELIALMDDRSPLANVMGPYQHARRIRLLR